MKEHITQPKLGYISFPTEFGTVYSKQELEALADVCRRYRLYLFVDGARMVKKMAGEYPGSFRFEYSPESFTGTEPEYALEVCNAVLEILEPSPENNVIINLPVTVEMSLPHIYASQVEYVSDNLICRESVTLSLHPHNDRGTAVADTELALLAGAQRVEGTLFGNGERTGNVDIVTLAMNMYSHGVDPKLDFSDMPSLVATYEKCTGMTVHPRSPYAGALVFAAFSGSHQDAIAKGMKFRKDNGMDTWNVPYLPVDPTDINRTYDSDVIRVNSQSGKGGIGYVIEQNYGFSMPRLMQEHFSYICKNFSDSRHVELKPADLLQIFRDTYFPREQARFAIAQLDFEKDGDDMVANVAFAVNGEARKPLSARGNGPLDAVSNAIKNFTGRKYLLDVYSEHSLQGRGSGSRAAAYIGLKSPEGKMFWGAATNTSIIRAGVDALVCAFDNLLADAE